MRNVKFALPLAGAAMMLVVVIGLAITGASPANSVAQVATQVPTNAVPLPTEDYPEADFASPDEAKVLYPLRGRDAIQVRPDIVSGQPAFTPQDVVAYLAENPFEYAASGQATSVIDSIEFMSARAVGEKLGRGVALPDEVLVCLVSLRGDFTVDGEFSGTTGYMIFDATTGNLLTVAVHR